ncbi:hypothetical protein MRX96_017956 [Rhipicephalus microplus]
MERQRKIARADESEFFRAVKMKDGDESLFYMFNWMSPATFDMLQSFVQEKLTNDQRLSSEPISSGERIALSLRYLSSRMLVRDAVMAFRVGTEMARNIIHESCTMLWEALCPKYMKQFQQNKSGGKSLLGSATVGSSQSALELSTASMYKLNTQRNGGRLYFDYKRTHSIVLMAVADSQYLFRCYVENVFGILVSCWQIYERQINLEPEIVEAVVKAACMLHNFLSSNATETYCLPGYADFQDSFGSMSGGAWRQGPGITTVFGQEKLKARLCSKVANAVRQEFVKYFNDEGQVPWRGKLPGIAPHQP